MLPEKNLELLLDLMFPGCQKRDLPAFSETKAKNVLTEIFEELPEIELLLRDMDFKSWTPDINAVVNEFKRTNTFFEQFILNAVISYFSDVDVATKLTGRKIPLFPNHSIMNDFDYELLEPVLIKFPEK